MVRHQAVRPDRNTGALGSIGQQIEIERVVPILKERPLAPIPALGDVMRNAGEDQARETGHEERLAWSGVAINSLGVIARVTETSSPKLRLPRSRRQHRCRRRPIPTLGQLCRRCSDGLELKAQRGDAPLRFAFQGWGLRCGG